MPTSNNTAGQTASHTPRNNSALTPNRWGCPTRGVGPGRPGGLLRGLALAVRAPWASFKATQVVVQRLDVGEDAHGVRLAAHHHHVLHLDEALAVGQIPETQKPRQDVRTRVRPSASPAPAPAPGPSGDPGDPGGHLLQGRAAQTPASRDHGVNARFHFNRLLCCKFQ